MQHHFATRRIRLALALTCVLCAPIAAHAQISSGVAPGSSGSGMMSGPPSGGAPDQASPGDQGGDDADKKAASPPPSLPGSHAQPTAVAPAAKNVTDLNPTSALFDAINRGDIAAARDAISRGADLGGKNVLGLTPVELSVDLGRNEISFLLLSMRGDGPAAPVAPVITKHGHVVPVSAPGRKISPTQAPAAAAAPDQGFLGFGGGS